MDKVLLQLDINFLIIANFGDVCGEEAVALVLPRVAEQAACTSADISATAIRSRR